MSAPVVPVVSVAYHSGYGHTAVLAEAVRAGAADAGDLGPCNRSTLRPAT